MSITKLASAAGIGAGISCSVLLILVVVLHVFMSGISCSAGQIFMVAGLWDEEELVNFKMIQIMFWILESESGKVCSAARVLGVLAG